MKYGIQNILGRNWELGEHIENALGT